jgi:hypothetical protein
MFEFVKRSTLLLLCISQPLDDLGELVPVDGAGGDGIGNNLHQQLQQQHAGLALHSDYGQPPGQVSLRLVVSIGLAASSRLCSAAAALA